MVRSQADTARAMTLHGQSRTFDDQFAVLFRAQFHRIYRYLDRMSGEPDVAEDLAQDAFVRLYRRQSMPDEPEAWLITVAMNLFRNLKSSGKRRSELLTLNVGVHGHSLASATPDEDVIAAETRTRVRSAVDAMTERERTMLLLRAEGYSYREIATALELNVASVGTLLARAQRAFRARYEETADAR